MASKRIVKKKADTKAKVKTKAKVETTGPQDHRFRKYCLVLLLTGIVILSWLSLLTASPEDVSGQWKYPPDEINNAAGIVGAHLANWLLYWLGGGVYMALFFATVTVIVLIPGGKITHVPWRIAGVVLLVVATSTAVYMQNPAAGSDAWYGKAGVIGAAADKFVFSKLGNVGSWVTIALMFCGGLILTVENLVLSIPKLGKKAWRERGRIPNALSSISSLRKAASDDKVRSAAASANPRVTVPSKPVKPVKLLPRTEPVAGNIEPTEKSKGKLASMLPFGKKKQPASAGGKTPIKQARRNIGDGSDGFVIPSADLLDEPSTGYNKTAEVEAARKKELLQQTLNDFNVQAEVVGYMTGPVITLYELSLSPGVKIAQVGGLANDIARALAVPGVRIVPPRFGKDTVGIEVPNLDKEIVRIKELMGMAPEAEHKMNLPLYLAKDAGGGPIATDLSAMPHMLIAGTTGSGKSVCINAIITSILMTRTPQEARLILVDPKMVEMAAFENIPHLLCPIINDMRKAESILEWAATKMDERYELLKEAGVRNIVGYNKLSKEELYERFSVTTDEAKAKIPLKIPYYVIIVDELADLIMTSSKEVENHIIRIAQKARAVGIHLILATQRPSANVVTGLIKSNMPCRISFRVASRQESRIVLDQNGAEVLMGQGDMLFLKPGTDNLARAQGVFIDDGEIYRIVKEIRKTGKPVYNAELTRMNTQGSIDGGGQRDELFDKAVEIVLTSQRGSVSLLQRRLQIGYSRSSRIIDQMAESGLLGDYKGSQARECLMTLEDWQIFQKSVDADQSGASSMNGEPTSV